MESENSRLCSNGSNTHRIRKDGLDTILKACKERRKQDLLQKLVQLRDLNLATFVHNDCRRDFNDLRTPTLPASSPATKRLRSSVHIATFNWKSCCLLCDKPIDMRHKERNKFREVQTLPIREKVIALARARGDSLGQKVLCRLEGCIDLVATEAVYHVGIVRKRQSPFSSND